MTKKEHRRIAKSLAIIIAKNLPTHLNIMGFEAALLVNYQLTVTKPTLEMMFKDYQEEKL